MPICPSCDSGLPADAAFCLRCGTRVGVSVALATDPVHEALERALGRIYDIKRLIGRGGMGAVYLAVERALEREVAIKVLPPEATSADHAERFRREARTAARLTHPNIVPLHTFGDVDGMMYFVMGYVRGESLGDRLRRDTRLSPDTTVRLVADVASALDYAHRQGVVHRDVKPDNILLDDESGRPMLTDFGIAKLASDGTLTEVGAAVGTPHYMSPEQAGGSGALDGRSDIYSLGVTAYAAMAGALPFDGESAQEIVIQHLTREPVSLGTRAPDVPPHVANAVMKCLAKDPALRWADARQLADALTTNDGGEAPLPLHLLAIDGQAFEAATIVALAPAVAGVSLFVPNLNLFPLYGVIVAGTALLDAGTSWYARRKGHSWDELKTLALRPPTWWPFWWPKRWRRPDDVWSRLPKAAQGIRTLYAAGWAQAVALAHVIGFGLGAVQARVDIADSILEGGIVTTFVLLLGTPTVWGIAYNRSMVWGRNHGLNFEESNRFTMGRTVDPAFWSRPKYASLLEAGVPEPPREVSQPDELMRLIADAAQALRGPDGVLGGQSISAARQVVEAVRELDKEIAHLAQDADRGEARRLRARIDASERDPELRELLQQQLDIVDRIARLLDVTSARREKLVELLRTLWLQLADVRARAAQDRLDPEMTGRIRSLCGEMQRHVEAREEVEQLTVRQL